MNVPFLDLKQQYGAIKDEIDAVLQEVINTCAFAGGPMTKKFESQFAPFCGCESAIGCGSGTEALWLALIGLGVGPGDEVITTPSTFIATSEAISFCGATPVFVDVVESTCNMNPALVEAAITPKTKAIIPVHLYGQMADMDPLMDIAAKHNLAVVEDACQAHGATYKGRRAGSIGNAGCFSFYPGKNLGAYGEAGAVVTSDEQLAETMATFRDHGQAKKYFHNIVGWNSRMDGFQGAVLGVKMKYIETWTRQRQENAALYAELLADIEGIETPMVIDGAESVYHLYVIQTDSRDELQAYLRENGIQTGLHYPIPLHLQEAYKSLGYKAGGFPVAEIAAKRILSLPMYPELREGQIRYVGEKIGDFFKKA
ncbi:DegT/DnrJ/EryC1/StrS family aminotransferase [Desulfosarcina ovata]|uniref:Glutamine--scyllo-inositol aminotransferase n=1 Tax=Desulfosarcina ovata subsp. ovata TaxID=2752305 RepID=A0A5K8AJL7_9BACT|nr:DegT/DnrJ/EryC1/StrS family aminotransferase [Desulfosarcina ovata]BBO92871.1 glutamine--scyllo-inositol aminotransferase [Desulfosarcina ovata subsp. ovata]